MSEILQTFYHFFMLIHSIYCSLFSFHLFLKFHRVFLLLTTFVFHSNDSVFFIQMSVKFIPVGQMTLALVKVMAWHRQEDKPRHEPVMTQGPVQYPIGRLFVRSRKFSKPRDLHLHSKLSDRSKIWRVPRQDSCRSAYQISKRCDDLNYKSRGFETSRDLTIKCLIRYWNGAQVADTYKPCWFTEM